MANYIKRDKNNENVIIIPDSTKLTEQDKMDISLYREFGYTVKISRAKKKASPREGYKKVQLIYYLENKAPDKLGEFLKEADKPKGYMKALQKFKKWYEEENGVKYEGQAAELIAANGKSAAARLKELEEEEKQKKKKNK